MNNKEYLEIRINNPYFKGAFSMAKLFLLIEKKEEEGWHYIGSKTFLKYSNIKINQSDSVCGLNNIVAIMEREKKSF